MSMHSSLRRKDLEVGKQTTGQRRAASRKRRRQRENQENLQAAAVQAKVSVLALKLERFNAYHAKKPNTEKPDWLLNGARGYRW